MASDEEQVSIGKQVRRGMFSDSDFPCDGNYSISRDEWFFNKMQEAAMSDLGLSGAEYAEAFANVKAHCEDQPSRVMSYVLKPTGIFARIAETPEALERTLIAFADGIQRRWAGNGGTSQYVTAVPTAIVAGLAVDEEIAMEAMHILSGITPKGLNGAHVLQYCTKMMENGEASSLQDVVAGVKDNYLPVPNR
ncbi:hypothetical protein ACFL1B_02150 [Nanoarchaeota archaeon]